MRGGKWTVWLHQGDNDLHDLILEVTTIKQRRSNVMGRFGVLCIHIFACGWLGCLSKPGSYTIVIFMITNVIVKLPMVSDNPNPWRTDGGDIRCTIDTCTKESALRMCLSMLDFCLYAAGVSTLVRKALIESGQYLTVDVSRC
jgi:hypothetical protein